MDSFRVPQVLMSRKRKAGQAAAVEFVPALVPFGLLQFKSFRAKPEAGTKRSKTRQKSVQLQNTTRDVLSLIFGVQQQQQPHLAHPRFSVAISSDGG